jgi:hypothetical protein
MIILEGMAVLSDREVPAEIVGKYVSVQARAERANGRTTVRLMSIREIQEV